MVLASLSWPDVEKLDRGMAVVLPVGSLEQHGPHLPLLTDTLIVTAVAEAVEARLPDKALLVPTLWLGGSSHHLAFPGTLNNPFEALIGSIIGVVESLARHGFYRFYVLNGHGGNTDPIGIAVRTLKDRHPNLSLAANGYYEFCGEVIADQMVGPQKTMRHSCEAETSLVLHLKPEWVHMERAVDDGLEPDPPVRGLVHPFHEVTQKGVMGYATLGTAEKGRTIFEAAVHAVASDVKAFAEGHILVGPA